MSRDNFKKNGGQVFRQPGVFGFSSPLHVCDNSNAMFFLFPNTLHVVEHFVPLSGPKLQCSRKNALSFRNRKNRRDEGEEESGDSSGVEYHVLVRGLPEGATSEEIGRVLGKAGKIT